MPSGLGVGVTVGREPQQGSAPREPQATPVQVSAVQGGGRSRPPGTQPSGCQPPFSLWIPLFQGHSLRKFECGRQRMMELPETEGSSPPGAPFPTVVPEEHRG